MSIQNDQQSDFDFSVIDKKPPEQGRLNFSVESLLDNNQKKSMVELIEAQNIQEIEQIELLEEDQDEEENNNFQLGSFMHDLQKFQEELSFETQVYNVYHDQTEQLSSSRPTKSYLLAKSNSNLKTTKEDSQEPSKSLHFDDYGYLVLDFSKKRQSKNSKIQKHSKSKCLTQGCKLKSSRSSGANTSELSQTHLKSKYKKSFNKFLSPRSKQISSKNTSKTSIGKNSIKKLSKSKSPNTKLKYNSSSSTAAEQASKTKQSGRSVRQANVYSQYYGFDDLVSSDQRFISKSNCLGSSNSQKIIVTKVNKTNLYPPSEYMQKNKIKQSSKSKYRKNIKSPSPLTKDISNRFKKKKK